MTRATAVPALRAMRRRLLSLCVLIGFATAFPVSSGAATEPDDGTSIDLSAYDGRWRRIDDGETEAARLSAIDRAISDLSWIVRKMASGVLQRTTRPPTELEFVWDGEHLHQGLQGKERDRSSPVQLDGQRRSGEDPRGVPFSWTWSLTEGGLRVRWEQHQAHGNNVYRIDESDGETLIIQHTINVTAISDVAPIVYRSRFSRRAPARAERRDASDMAPSDMAQSPSPHAAAVESID